MKALSTKEQMEFLMALRLGNSVTKSCQKAGISRRRVYYFKAEDPEFDEAWADAIASSVDELEDHLRARALDPDDKSGHLLLMFLLKKINPEYRDSFKGETKKQIAKTQEFDFSVEEIDSAQRLLQLAKDKAISSQSEKNELPPQAQLPPAPDSTE